MVSSNKRDYLTSRDRISVHHTNVGPSMTRQEFKRECDVKWIMDRFQRTGMLGDPRKSKRIHQFIDCTSVQDFESARKLIINAQQSFDSLPNEFKKMFNYKISNFMRMVNDPAVADDVVKKFLADKQGSGAVPAPDGSL